MNKEIYLYLKEIKGTVNSILIYLNDKNNDINIDEIKDDLLYIKEVIDNINTYLYKDSKLFIDRDEFISYLYYLKDKIDEIYKKEVTISINRFINKIMEVKEYEQL